MTTEEQQIIDAAAQTAAETVVETADETAAETTVETADETAAETTVETADETADEILGSILDATPAETENMIAFFSKKAAHFSIAHEIALELQLREAYTHEVLTCNVSATEANHIHLSEIEAIAELLPITDEISIANEFNTRIVALLECMLGKSIQPVQVLSGGAQNEIVN